ncbi:histidine kinase [Gracilimonas halophila]|uniref:Histidine kinase n=1 Tax=Gracilimonas halophila TaxID=1834464 RepID=A0ABW5JHR5_9BACT
MKFPRIDLKKLLLYLLFWGVFFYAGLEFFSRTEEIRVIDVIYTLNFLLPFVFVVSVHAFHLVPNYLAKSMFWAYGLTLVCLLGTVYPIYNFSFLLLSEWLFPGYYLVGTYTPFEVIGFALFFLLISSSLEFARSWFDGLRAKTRISELENEKIATELKALRAQVNPHFLFNSLNTIYSEALKKSDEAIETLNNLSQSLFNFIEEGEGNNNW